MKKFFAILLASLTLFMNLGLTVNSHYCGGELAESSLTFGQGNIDCGMESEQTPCKKSSHENTVKKKKCCENEFSEFQIDDEYNKTVIESSTIDLKFIAVFVISYINSFRSFKPSFAPLAPLPPILDRDIQVMNQSFLI